jgi:hypothetical protein
MECWHFGKVYERISRRGCGCGCEDNIANIHGVERHALCTRWWFADAWVGKTAVGHWCSSYGPCTVGVAEFLSVGLAIIVAVLLAQSAGPRLKKISSNIPEGSARDAKIQMAALLV